MQIYLLLLLLLLLLYLGLALYLELLQLIRLFGSISCLELFHMLYPNKTLRLIIFVPLQADWRFLTAPPTLLTPQSVLGLVPASSAWRHPWGVSVSVSVPVSWCVPEPPETYVFSCLSGLSASCL